LVSASAASGRVRGCRRQRSARRPSTVASDTSDLERIVRIVQGTRHVSRREMEVVFSTPFEGRPLPIRAAARPPRSDSRVEA
jgi:hypothetical protein